MAALALVFAVGAFALSAGSLLVAQEMWRETMLRGIEPGNSDLQWANLMDVVESVRNDIDYLASRANHPAGKARKAA